LEAAKERRVANLKENKSIRSAGVRSLQSQSAEFEQLGLVQGQQLMLIDLEKCTRCGACVEACVDAHADGRNRLYLDGPRFDKYLVPITCRSCLDPVCLIGCPVGAIYRGDNGEIRIRNHCIGCSLCADQCPYGSIHMSDRELNPSPASGLFQLESGVVLKEFTQRAVVCDMCSSHSSQEPSCVYACPHDAALRVDARAFFGVSE
jgi:Fe-S-cluster-containing hydrogenase component 2